jgi:hypothetical protein
VRLQSPLLHYAPLLPLLLQRMLLLLLHDHLLFEYNTCLGQHLCYHRDFVTGFRKRKQQRRKEAEK